MGKNSHKPTNANPVEAGKDDLANRLKPMMPQMPEKLQLERVKPHPDADGGSGEQVKIQR
jgi:hypothetical protein